MMLPPTRRLLGYVARYRRQYLVGLASGVVATALPLLGMSSLLAARAFMVRPWFSGALYGLGAGLTADAGWRLFCEFSDPAHVFPTHTGAVVAVMLFGAVSAAIVAKRLRR